ncbi:MAG: helix-turn-helix transcriptional regulator [Kiritimatiellae bacterium]|nr:helix-turn-helix transcriptional regulator [Kiritimatiellia bacterium]
MGTFTAKNRRYFSIAEKIHPPDYRGRFHTQNFCELTLIIGGQGAYESMKGRRRTIIPVEPDTLLFCDGRVLHRCTDSPGHPLHQLMICFGYGYPAPFSLLPALLSAFKKTNPIVLRPPQTTLHLKPLIRRMLMEHNEAGAGSADTIKALLILLLTEIYRLIHQAANPGDGEMDERVRQAVTYLRLHYDQHFHLPECAKRCGLSVRHFSELFRRHTGKTFVQFLNEYRIGIAKDLLRSTDKKVITIAFETGFENLSLFNRTFKKLCRLTPNQYRRGRNV